MEFREWDDYEFEDSYVLRNKVGAVDFDALDEAERLYTRMRLRELAGAPIEGDFDRSHMEAIHAHIFQDLYEWAGQVRVGGAMVKEAPDVLAESARFGRPHLVAVFLKLVGPTCDSPGCFVEVGWPHP